MRKKVPKKASGTATPEAARPDSRNSQISAFRALPCPALVFAQACQSLTAFGSCAHWAHAPSRPKLRPAVAPSGLSSSSVRFAHPPGKRLLLPILAAGLAMSRAAELASLRMLSCALGARLFPPPKWAGLFPFAAYRRSAPPQLAVGRLIPCGVNGFLMVGWLCRDKGQQVFEKMLAFVASHEACRRMAVCTRQQTGNYTTPASRGTCRATAIKPRPARISHEHPARHSRAEMGAGL